MGAGLHRACCCGGVVEGSCATCAQCVPVSGVLVQGISILARVRTSSGGACVSELCVPFTSITLTFPFGCGAPAQTYIAGLFDGSMILSGGNCSTVTFLSVFTTAFLTCGAGGIISTGEGIHVWGDVGIATCLPPATLGNAVVRFDLRLKPLTVENECIAPGQYTPDATAFEISGTQPGEIESVDLSGATAVVF